MVLVLLHCQQILSVKTTLYNTPVALVSSNVMFAKAVTLCLRKQHVQNTIMFTITIGLAMQLSEHVYMFTGVLTLRVEISAGVSHVTAFIIRTGV